MKKTICIQAKQGFRTRLGNNDQVEMVVPGQCVEVPESFGREMIAVNFAAEIDAKDMDALNKANEAARKKAAAAKAAAAANTPAAIQAENAALKAELAALKKSKGNKPDEKPAK